MSSVAFNGTVVQFAGTSGTIASTKSVRYQGSCARVQTTGSDAASKLFVPGLPSESITVDTVGSLSLSKGTTGTLSVVWADGGTAGSLTKARIMKTPSMSGSIDGPNQSTVVFQLTK